MTAQLLFRVLLTGTLVVCVSELAKRNNLAASIVHSLPLVSLAAVIWLFAETRDSALVARHMAGTFWMVLPTLPLFLVVPRLLRGGWAFWPALGIGAAMTVLLYLAMLRLLRAAGVQF